MEKADHGTYWGTTQNIPGVVTVFGNSMEKLKFNLKVAFEDYLEVAKEGNEAWSDEIRKISEWGLRMGFMFLFLFDSQGQNFGYRKKAKINESLMRQYVSGKASVFEERVNLLKMQYMN